MRGQTTALAGDSYEREGGRGLEARGGGVICAQKACLTNASGLHFLILAFLDTDNKFSTYSIE